MRHHSVRNHAFTALITTIVLMIVGANSARAAAPAGGGEYPQVLPTDQMSDAQRSDIAQQIDANIALLRAQGKLTPRRGSVSFDWPLAAASTLADPGFHGVSNFVDHNATFPGALLDYDCGARSYDLSNGYNHRGIDFFTWPFGWQKMDNDEVNILAAAAGTIVLKSDGNFDRSCGFGGGNWNAVYVRHADGSIAWYGHMKNGSTTSKVVGDAVSAGEVLGVVGSSGSSTGPHLHLEVYDVDNNLIDPYQGTCNSLNSDSWWGDQRAYFDSAINKLSTGFAPPTFPACPITELPNTRRLFVRGEDIYFAAYYRDQLATQSSSYTIRRPDGSVFSNWQHSSNAPHYAASYWFWRFRLGANEQTGVWTFSVDYDGTLSEHNFEIIANNDSDGDGVDSHQDNCVDRANPSQFDADNDGYGNRCDADFNNDNIVNAVDLGYFRAVFFSNDEVADLDESGTVNAVDLGLFRTLFFLPPGPSAFAP